MNAITTAIESAKDLVRRNVALTPLQRLEEPFLSKLSSMYRCEPQVGDEGQVFSMDDSGTRISPQQGMWLYDLCRQIKPQATLEVGLAYGFSMLFFLAAIKKNGHGRHTTIDPFPWHGIAYANAREVGMPLDVINEISERAAVDLVRAGRQFDVIFIDGNHRFDNCLLDFTLLAKACNIDGYIIIDDMWMKSIRAVASFIQTNRRDFTHVSTPVRNIAVFKKIGDDTRKWDHFRGFPV